MSLCTKKIFKFKTFVSDVFHEYKNIFVWKKTSLDGL